MSRAFVSKGGAAVGVLTALMHEPAVWGFLGAFIYAAPRLAACLASCRESGASGWTCALEFAIALATGAIAAAAFAAVAMGLTQVKDSNAVSATLGLLANPVAPKLVKGASGMLAAVMGSKLGRLLQGDDKP